MTRKIGDRVAFDNIKDVAFGTISDVVNRKYRIEWDDGFKDEEGDDGLYTESELAPEAL